LAKGDRGMNRLFQARSKKSIQRELILDTVWFVLGLVAIVAAMSLVDVAA
jgi:hypothetical protein